MTTRAEERIKAELEPIDVEKAYKNMLDEVYGDVEVCGMTMNAGDVLKEMDHIAYQCGMNDWTDNQITDEVWTDEIDGKYYDFDEAESIIDEVEREEADEEEQREKDEAAKEEAEQEAEEK